MLRALAPTVALAVHLLAGTAVAACDGPSLFDTLSPDDRATLDARVAETPYPEGIFWRAKRDGLTVTLVGTMHISDPRLEPVFARAQPLLEQADLLLVEMTRFDQVAMQDALARDPSLMFLTDGPTLPEQLDDATWDRVAEALRDRGIPPFVAAKFRPWFLSLMLATPACAMEGMASPEAGLDFMMMDAAATLGLPQQALEPWDTLFTIFESGTEEEQLDALRASIIDPELQEQSFVATIDGYFSGDIARVWELGRLTADDMPGTTPEEAAAMFAEFEEMLLLRRNRAWVDVIETAAAEHGEVMVAAGAAHLPGEEGVLNLLAGRGWTIARLD